MDFQLSRVTQASYPEQIPIQRDDFRLKIIRPLLLCERRLQVHLQKFRDIDSMSKTIDQRRETEFVSMRGKEGCGIRWMYD